MPQDRRFVDDVLDMLYPLNVRARRMFGSFGLYCDEKFVMILNDDQIYLKRSGASPVLLERTELSPPFEGATDWHLVPEDVLHEREWLRETVQAIADALPTPKPGTSKGRRGRKARGGGDYPSGHTSEERK